jgi:hypothetical protein
MKVVVTTLTHITGDKLTKNKVTQENITLGKISLVKKFL